LTHVHSRAGAFARLFLCAAILAAFISETASAGVSTTTDPAGDTPRGNLTANERRAIDIKSVTLSGDESLGILATVKFGGNITRAIGRGHLRRARAELILRPASSDVAPARLATKGPGIVGETVRQTRSRKVGVVRRGRILSFFVFGPGFSNVSTAEVRVVLPGNARAVTRGGKPAADTTGPVPVPQGPLNCSDLVDELDRVDAAIEAARAVKKAYEEGVERMNKAIDNLNSETFLKAVSWFKGKLGLTDSIGKKLGELRKARDDLVKGIKEMDEVIDSFEADRKKIKAKLRECQGGGTPPPPLPCSSTLERSPGGEIYTATNHIRVRAMCSQPVTEISVTSLSGDTFDACAQTLGTATTCSASGDLLDAGWNAPANEQLEAYGRVTANADGNYRVRVRGAGAVLLHQYDATVPP
jgi:hypothetical protein